MTKITDKYHFFWKDKTPLSNWYKEKYTLNDGIKQITFNCSEKEFAWRKSMLFGDFETALKIMEAEHPSQHQKFGREVRNFNQKTWDENKEQIWYEVLKNKFTNSSQETKDYLKNTAPLICVEASPDRIYGCGLLENNEKINDENNWSGLNLLGELLTQLRINLYGK